MFKQFLIPANVEPERVRTAELTLMMVQLVASGRGLCALPNWVLAEYVEQGLINVLPAGERGVFATLYAAVRQADRGQHYVDDFLQLARVQCLKKLKGVKPA